MSSCYFAQYLLDSGVLKEADVQGVLHRAAAVEPGVALLALENGLVSASQLEALDGKLSDVDFIESALEEHLLTASQISNLRQAAVRKESRLAQLLLDEGVMSLSRLESALQECEALEPNPVEEIVERVLKSRGAEFLDTEIYTEYVDLFFVSLQRFMDTDVVIVSKAGESVDSSRKHLVSQRMTGDLGFAGGVYADEKTLINIARRYSHEDITRLNDMAIDCLSEFINVLNGLYIVNLSKRQMDVDLETPQYREGLMEHDEEALLQFEVLTDFGAFTLAVSHDASVL